ncbi:MAG: ATP-binding protein [Gammaproteobacteria bacterium]|nr:ATP-binding protein [Gammaproteobacteria bacterium]
MLLTFSLVLVGLNVGTAAFYYISSTNQIDREQDSLRELKVRELSSVFRGALESISTLGYFIPRLAGLPDDRIDEVTTPALVEALDKQGLMLNVEWAIEGLHFFGETAVESPQLSWPKDREVPPVADLVRSTFLKDAVANRVVCFDDCVHVAALPILFRGETAGVLVVEQAIGDVLAGFNRLSGFDVAVVHSGGASPQAVESARDSSDRTLHWKAGGDLADRVIPTLTGAAMAEIKDHQPHRIGVGNEWFEVLETSVVPAADDVSVLLVSRVTGQVEAFQNALVDSVWLGIVGLVGSELLLLILMWSPMRRVQQAVDALPLLADRSYAQLRDHLPAPSASGSPRDEVDAMILAIDQVADRIERLDDAGREAEKRLRRSEHRLQLAQSMARVVGWSGEPIPGWFSFAEGAERVHPMLAKISRWPEFIEIVHPEDRINVLRAWRSGRPGSAMDVEFRLRTSGTEIHLHAVARFEAVGPTRILRAAGMMQDVSEMRAVQRELRYRRDRLEDEVALRTQELAAERNRAQQLAESKSQFLANMSHEIRTPLTAVLGLSQIGVQESQNRKIASTFEQILAAGDHLLDVVNDVLDLSKLDSGGFTIAAQPFLLMPVAKQSIEMFRQRADAKGLALRLEIADALPEAVKGDRLRLQQILINLIGNAIKFTENGEVTLQLASTGDEVSFRVRDTGMGMQPSQLHRLFEPYFQHASAVGEAVPGTGLGLTISRRIAVLMGGDIDVHSSPGVGSEFTLTLPLPTVGAEQVKPTVRIRPEGSERQLAGLRVLIADDVAVNRTVIEHLLDLEGASVIAVSNGRDVVDALATDSDDSVDIVLMDVHMPVVDGREATRQIRKAGIDIPIIGVTADISERERTASLDAGMQDQLVKPLIQEALVRSILSHVEPAQVGRTDSKILH